jgi:hypothetical protein
MSSRAELTEKWAILRKLLKTVISRSAPSVLQLAVINLEQSKTAIQHNVQWLISASSTIFQGVLYAHIGFLVRRYDDFEPERSILTPTPKLALNLFYIQASFSNRFMDTVTAL